MTARPASRMTAIRPGADPVFWLHCRNAIWNFRLRPGQHRRSWTGDRAGLPRLSRHGGRSRGAGLPLELPGRASLHRLESGLGDADAADGAGDAHHEIAARHGGDRAAVAQSGAARRAGGDPRSHLQRPVRFRHRQGIPAQRVRGLSHPDRGGRTAFRGIRRGDDQGVRLARALLASRAVLAVRRYRGRAAALAETAPAVLGGGRKRCLDHRAPRAAAST